MATKKAKSSNVKAVVKNAHDRANDLVKKTTAKPSKLESVKKLKPAVPKPVAKAVQPETVAAVAQAVEAQVAVQPIQEVGTAVVRSVTRPFAEMLECLRQYDAGLLHTAELILALQCDEFQVAALRQMLSLPNAVVAKLTVADFDDSVESARIKSA